MGTELEIVAKGNISGGFKREVSSILQDCYRRFGSKAPNKVEVQIVGNETTMRDLLRAEKIKLGITTSDEEEFSCSYDAWRGYPRIIVCSERLAKLKKLTRMGVVRHEAAHSALHGSLEYCIFRIPKDCRHTAMIKGMDSTVLEQALYYLSIAVKDFEATRFLVEHDYINCQVAFALEWLQPSEKDKATWKLASANRQARFVYLMTLLKPVLFAHPLLSLPRSKKISLEQQVYLGRRVEELVEHLAEAERNKLLQVANMMVDSLNSDTHDNVDVALRQAMGLA